MAAVKAGWVEVAMAAPQAVGGKVAAAASVQVEMATATVLAVVATAEPGAMAEGQAALEACEAERGALVVAVAATATAAAVDREVVWVARGAGRRAETAAVAAATPRLDRV